MILFRCACDEEQVLGVQDEQAGAVGACPSCGSVLRVPQTSVDVCGRLRFERGGVRVDPLSAVAAITATGISTSAMDEGELVTTDVEIADAEEVAEAVDVAEAEEALALDDEGEDVDDDSTPDVLPAVDFESEQEEVAAAQQDETVDEVLVGAVEDRTGVDVDADAEGARGALRSLQDEASVPPAAAPALFDDEGEEQAGGSAEAADEVAAEDDEDVEAAPQSSVVDAEEEIEPVMAEDDEIDEVIEDVADGAEEGKVVGEVEAMDEGAQPEAAAEEGDVDAEAEGRRQKKMDRMRRRRKAMKRKRHAEAAAALVGEGNEGAAGGEGNEGAAGGEGDEGAAGGEGDEGIEISDADSELVNAVAELSGAEAGEGVAEKPVRKGLRRSEKLGRVARVGRGSPGDGAKSAAERLAERRARRGLSPVEKTPGGKGGLKWLLIGLGFLVVAYLAYDVTNQLTPVGRYFYLLIFEKKDAAEVGDKKPDGAKEKGKKGVEEGAGKDMEPPTGERKPSNTDTSGVGAEKTGSKAGAAGVTVGAAKDSPAANPDVLSAEGRGKTETPPATADGAANRTSPKKDEPAGTAEKSPATAGENPAAENRAAAEEKPADEKKSDVAKEETAPDAEAAKEKKEEPALKGGVVEPPEFKE